MTKPKPAEQKQNGYSDEDLAQINERLDEAIEERDDAIRKAKDAYKRRVKVIEAEAKAVGVLIAPLKVARQVRDLEAKIKAKTKKVKADEIELFEDMMGQMTFLKPEKVGESAAQVAARQLKASIAKVTAEEQAEGERVLAELAGNTVN